MITQAELLSNGETRVVWVQHDVFNGQELKTGMRLVLNEEPNTAYTVGRTFLPLGDGSVLPPKSRKGTIFCYIEDEKQQAEADLAASYPPISVSNGW